ECPSPSGRGCREAAGEGLSLESPYQQYLQIHQVGLRRAGDDQVARSLEEIRGIIRAQISQRNQSQFNTTRAGEMINDASGSRRWAICAISCDTGKTRGR